MKSIDDVTASLQNKAAGIRRLDLGKTGSLPTNFAPIKDSSPKNEPAAIVKLSEKAKLGPS